MSRFLALVSLVVGLGLPLYLHAAPTGDWRFMAEITGMLTPGTPVRVPLSSEIIAATSHGFADLRIFDTHGQETPYVIHAQRASKPTPSTFTFRMLSYSQSDTGETIVLERPEETGPLQEIDIATTARNFHKSVRVQTSDDLSTWEDQAADTIFDYSAHLALRKTTIDLARVDTRYVRLHLQDVTPSPGPGGDLTLRYDGLELSVRKGETRQFRIDHIVGRSSTTPPILPVYDRMSFPQPDTRPDKSGNTVIALGRVNLPMTEVALHVDTPYYHRTVEIWTADVDTHEAYRRVASGVVYNIPGMPTPKNTLPTPPVQAGYVRVKILNGDSPPLRIQHLTVAWPRYEVYFIPESGRGYTLYCGNEQRRAPVYDLQHVLPFNPIILLQYSEAAVGQLQPNPAYHPAPAQRLWFLTDTWLFTGLILLLAGVLGVWIYRLMQRLPAQ